MLTKLRSRIPDRTAALVGADALILLCVIAELHLQALGYPFDQTSTAALFDGQHVASSAMMFLVGTIGLAPIVFNRWDFRWDHRSWSLRGIAATALLVILSATVVLGPSRGPGWEGAPHLTVQNSAIYYGIAAIAALCLYLIRRGARILPLHIMLIGAGTKAAKVEQLADRSGGAITIVRRMAVANGPAGQQMLAPATAGLLRRERINEVVVAIDDQRGFSLYPLLHWKLGRGIRVTDYLNFWERECGRVDLGVVSPAWFVYGDGCRAGLIYSISKRSFDVVVSLLLLILTAPVSGICAGLIWLESGGPVLYRQERVGRYGRPFMLLKFRSMHANAEAAGHPEWAQARDPRTTRVGRIIRRFRIDEIPQLWNVLRNEMSIIGPRPERPYFVDELAQDIPFYRDRHWIKPGITGWAQVNFSYGASLADAREKLSYDLYYLKNATLLLDFFIAISTIRVVLFQEGAR